MDTLEERVARLALRTFDELPNKSKPRIHPDGSREWVPMSAIVLVCDGNSASEQLTCVTLATGCKCLPSSYLPKCHGRVLHDSHAEVLALRGFNRFLLSEVSQILNSKSIFESRWLCARSSPDPDQSSSFGGFCVRSRQQQSFEIRSNISIHMFSTEAPCGDASMEILMWELGPDESVPWEAPKSYGPPTSETPIPGHLQGRSFFSNLGALRRKPSRPDAEPTLSKSCTDKLCVKQMTSLLSFPTYHFFAPTPNAYLASLILPAEKFSETGCQRAFGPTGRLSALQKSKLPEGYTFHPFQVIALPKDFQPVFPFSKPSPTPTPDKPPSPSQTHPKARPKKSKPKPTNLSALYIHPPTPTPTYPSANPPPGPINETLLSGLLQGHSLQTLPPPSHTHAHTPNPRTSSQTSRSHMFHLGQQLAAKLLSQPQAQSSVAAADDDPLRALLTATTYEQAKTMGGETGIGMQRRRVKDEIARGLPGYGERGDGSVGAWIRNVGDEDWSVPISSVSA